MTGMTDYTAQHLLDWSVGKTAMPSLPTVSLGLFTVVGTDAGSGFTEVTGGSYARVTTAGADWNAASGTAPSSNSNANALTFPLSTGSWGTVIAWGLFDAASAGNMLWWDFLGNDPWFPFSCTAANPGVLTAIGITAGSSPVLANGDTVVLTGEYGGALPTGLTQYTQYTVAGLAADVFNLGTLTSTTGAGNVRKITAQSIPSNVTPSFSGGSLTLLAA